MRISLRSRPCKTEQVPIVISGSLFLIFRHLRRRYGQISWSMIAFQSTFVVERVEMPYSSSTLIATSYILLPQAPGIPVICQFQEIFARAGAQRALSCLCRKRGQARYHPGGKLPGWVFYTSPLDKAQSDRAVSGCLLARCPTRRLVYCPWDDRRENRILSPSTPALFLTHVPSPNE